MQKIWQYLKALGQGIFKFMLRYPLATALTVFLVIGALVLSFLGQKIQIGGILGWLWGKKTTTDPDIRVLPPPERVDANGQPIVPGQPDQQGYVQAPAAIQIKPPSILSNPNTITIIHPQKGEVTIPLPTGVKNDDVSSIAEISPNCYQLASHDKGVDTNAVLNILNKP